MVIEVYPGDEAKLPAKVTLSTYSEKAVSIGMSADQSIDFVLPDFVEKYGRCGGCNEVLGQASIQALGASWHDKCFVCQKCKEDVEGSFFVVNGAPLCVACKEASAEKCNRCNDPISGFLSSNSSNSFNFLLSSQVRFSMHCLKNGMLIALLALVVMEASMDHFMQSTTSLFARTVLNYQ